MNFLATLKARMTGPKVDTPDARTDAAVESWNPAPKRPAYIEERLRTMRTEQARIMGLPAVSYEGSDYNPMLRRYDLDHMCKECSGQPFELMPVQSEMLAALCHVGGLLAFAGTGSGKSCASVLMGRMFPDVTRTLIFAPSSTLETAKATKMHMRLHFNLPPDVQFHSYEAMQRATPEGEMDYIEKVVLANGGDPAHTLVIFDEAHALRNLTSARGGRVMRLRMKHLKLRFAMLSGTLTDTSIKDCAHLAWMSLGEGSPFPGPFGREDEFDQKQASKVLSNWAACLDKGGEPGPDDWRAIASLWAWAYPDLPLTGYVGAERTLMIRKAFQHRLKTCPGVVMTSETSLKDTALRLHGINIPVPKAIIDALALVNEEGLDPDGNVLADKKAIWRIIRQLAQGFFYIWDWPTDLLTGKPIRDDEWLLARASWNKHVRTEILYRGDNGYDSALLVYTTAKRQLRELAQTDLQRAWLEFVGRSCKDESPGVVAKRERTALAAWQNAGGLGQAFGECERYFIDHTYDRPLLRSWVEWSARLKHKQKPPKKAIWVSTWFIDFAMEWVAKEEAAGHKVILWYDFTEVGDELARRGLKVCGAGTEPPTKAVTCALSIKTHSEGKNLQAWSRQLVLSPPMSGKTWEQLLARCHRTKQKAAVVDCWIMQHVDAFVAALVSARAGADFAQPITGNGQKLLHAEYLNIKVPKVGSDKYDQRQAEKSFDMEEDDDE